MIGAATLDRLRHGAHKIILDGDSYRGLKSASDRPATKLAKEAKITHS
jgi:DNA replication protein DnaC